MSEWIHEKLKELKGYIYYLLTFSFQAIKLKQAM